MIEKTNVETIRELHHIFYLPGTGGNFMCRLFSLSEDTQFLWIRGTCGCMPQNTSLEEKLKWYSFKPSDCQRWGSDAHLMPYGVNLNQQHHFYNPGSKLITTSHYHWHVTPKNGTLALGNPDRVKEHYYHIDADEELYTFMNRYLKLDANHENKPGGYQWALRNALVNNNQGITLEPISLKKILADRASFLEEYKRVCACMGLTPVDDEIAVTFVENWKTLRVNNPDLKTG